MNHLNYSTSLSAPEESATVADWEFIRLHDQKPGDVPEEYEAELTRGDVVEIFASIFGRGSCGTSDSPDSYSGPVEGETPTTSATNYLTQKYAGVAGAQQMAAEFGLGNLCLPETLDGGEIERPVYLHASSDWIFDDYNIVSYDAKLSKYSVREHDIYTRIEFSNASYTPLYYYVDLEKLGQYLRSPSAYGDIYEWRGSVKDENGDTVDNPVWTIKNGRVYFAGNWSGILIIKRLPIKYHIYTLTISGTVGADATRHYDARVSAKPPGLAAVHLDVAEEIRAEETKEKCPWLDFEFGPNGNGTGIDTTCGKCKDPAEQEEPEPEPPPTCDRGITAEEYNEECCGGPLPSCLPTCRSMTTTIQGPIAGEKPDEYCGPTTVITLMPEDGKPCGQMTKTWTTTGNCNDCDSAAPIVWGTDNPETVAQGSSVLIQIAGGRATVTWSLSGTGQGFTFSNGATEIETGRFVTVYAAADSCGTITVVADDGCTKDRGALSSTGGSWILDKDTLSGDGLYYTECTVTAFGGDGLAVKKKYIQDWCNYDEGACTGSEQQVCEKPSAPEPLRRVEGEKVWKWGC